MDSLIFVDLHAPEIVPLEGFASHSTLLSEAHRFRSLVVLAFCDSSVPKSPELSIFRDVPPSNGKWSLEIALELPDLLPVVGGKSESVIRALDNAGVQRELCISNRMSRFHYRDSSMGYQVLAPRTQAWHGAVGVRGEDAEVKTAAEEQLRSVASMRFQIQGADAENALETCLRSSVESMFGAINRVIEAVRECRLGLSPLSRRIRWDRVPYVYVLLTGEGEPRGARLTLSGGRVILNSESLEDEAEAKFRSIADGSVVLTDIDRLLGEARSSWQDGEYEFSFLQAVIAAEIATARLVQAVCLQRGISKSRLDGGRKEMTFSWALNIGLALCLDRDAMPPSALMASMNRARRVRNELMHEAEFSLGREAVGEVIQDSSDFVEALRTAEQRLVLRLHPDPE